MKWTQEYVWEKVESVVPNARLSYNALPEALNRAAVDLFLQSEVRHTGSYRAYVIEACILELRQNGLLSFGSVGKDWG